ncbi:MAG: methylenetetrahydrofolate reductase [Clostridia bacterium]|nr:methylenetetrahydrofolate reductase [Clostridia bacterium]
MAKISFEVFPPKKDQGINHINDCIKGLSSLKPEFISVTYNAGVSTENLTVDTCKLIQEQYNVNAVAHLTCAGQTTDSIINQLKIFKDNNITRVLALRGDITPEKPIIELRYATDLIKVINDFGGFEVYASCYPEGHVESKETDKDIDVMKMKDDLGVIDYISQLFFDNKFFYNMYEKARNIGVKGQIEPGIMPILNVNSVSRMVSLCGASIPRKCAKYISKYKDDKDSLVKWGIDFASKQIIDLIENGIEVIHLYTMDNATIATQIYNNIKSFLD